MCESLRAEVQGQTRNLNSSEAMAPYTASTKPPIEIGRRVKASILVSGTLLRSCDRTILDMKVVDVRSGEPIWTHRYETTLARLPQTATDAAQAITQTLAAKPRTWR